MKERKKVEREGRKEEGKKNPASFSRYGINKRNEEGEIFNSTRQALCLFYTDISSTVSGI